MILDVKPDGGIEFMTRPTAGAPTTFLAGATASFPVWLKLVRSGSTASSGGSVTGFMWSDGSTWTRVESTDVSFFFFVKTGLAVTSHDTSLVNTASFEFVGVTMGGT